MSSVAALSCCASCGAIYRHDYPRCPADGAEIIQTDRDPLIGTIVDGYAIDSLLGEGGMGRVYVAHREGQPDTRYAIKVMLGDLAATVKARKRFVQEAEKLAQVKSPHVVAVAGQGTTAGGLPYIVLDYLEGQPISALIAGQPMAPHRVIALARQIAEGLRAAHAAGIVHRDLKPDNVLVTRVEGREVAHLIDFGLAIADDDSDTRLTSTGIFMATPAYAAPEQVTASAIDQRVDLYALGTSMFEMLTGGMLPFEGSAMQCATAKAHHEAPRLSERAAHLLLPEPLQALVASLLRRRADERPRDAAAVIAALTELAKPPRPARPAWLVPVIGIVAAAIVVTSAVVVVRRSAHHRVASMVVADAAPAPVALPSPPPEPTPAPAPVAVVAVASPEAPPEVPTPATTPRRRPALHAPVRASRPTTAVTSPVVVPELPPPPPPVAPPAPAPVLHASLASLDVSGPLSVAEVRRAVSRLVSAFDRCAPSAPATVTARFSIGEHRRAERVATSGAPASTNACLSRALGALRTESAPDVGDVSVTAQVQFSAVP